ncbi:MAG: hypothetical protein ACKVP5_09840 [Aestuariivirga sp.]
MMVEDGNRFKLIGQRAANGGSEPGRLILSQLEQLLLEENATLERNGQTDHVYFIERKNHILRELIVLQRTSAVNGDLAGNIEELKSLVARNLEVLEANIKAIKEVSDALKNAALAEEADGTYSLDERRRGMAS